MGQTIAVVSGKGGTGKTSFTANVGMALAQLGRSVLCIDCDAGLRNLDIVMAMTDRAVMDFTDVTSGFCSLQDAVVAHPLQKGLYLLTAPAELPPQGVDPAAFRRLLYAARAQYDYCLLDAPAGLGSGFRMTVQGADRSVVVTTTDASSLRDAQRTVMELNHPPKNRVHLVVNRCQPRLLRSLHQTIDDAIDTAGLPLLGVVPEDETMPLYAGRGIPLLLSGNNCAARAYRNIARRLTGQRVPLMRLR